MLSNYIKIAFRNLLRFKGYTLINFIGLSIGLTVGILIMLFAINETSFDQMHSKADRIYRTVTLTDDSSAEDGYAGMGWGVGHELRTKYPEVESVVYFKSAFSLNVFDQGKQYEHKLYFASNDFFNVFSFDVLEGDAGKALAKPNSVVITKEMKERYFGKAEALGKLVALSDSSEYEVTAVLDDLPANSHLQFDMLLSFTTYEQMNPYFTYSGGWGNLNVFNYVLLKPDVDVQKFKAKVRNIYLDNAGEMLQSFGASWYVGVEPLNDIYLRSNISNPFGPNGSWSQVVLVISIAVFIIILACINFINLTTARSVYRAKEVGLRKVVGSSRTSLFWQFLSESFFLTLLSFIVVVIILDIVLPYFNQLMGRSYSFSQLFSIQVIAAALILVIVVSFLAGFYPAIVLSGYKPISILSGKMQTSKRGVGLRKVLVVCQFVISSGLVLATLIVIDQLQFMKNQDLGFSKDQVLVLDLKRLDNAKSLQVLKNQLTGYTGVQSLAYTNALPGRPGWQGQVAIPEGFPDDKSVTTEYMAVDEDYINTLELNLLAGRNFDLSRVSDLDDGLIINEVSMKEMGWVEPEQAIGKKITSPSGYPKGTIIAVVKDYHGVGLQEKIWPKVMDYNPQAFSYLAIRLSTGNTGETISNIGNLWGDLFPDYTFDYYFLDQDFDRQYAHEERLISVLTLFTILTVVVAAIGLLGLISFMILSKSKEIGVRKVLGASSWSISKLLSKEFMILIIIANILVIPFVWYFGTQWLEQYAYHIELNLFIFPITILVTVCIAFLVVGVKTIRASLSNPVETLRAD
ncbi:ABC transporter permease [Fulvivirga maritima]|uniref:FtsX-like permease family protein n=1 Tax=Fulvivirga maritima TaxID=2904247 RepID=UPI001F38131E|nr:FtsX-like permease family protein [Fulvivirga maritima]UII29354.1 ABC transporter permease [Fulvivirga maritima]